jgi:uncharacterized membrane protein
MYHDGFHHDKLHHDLVHDAANHYPTSALRCRFLELITLPHTILMSLYSSVLQYMVRLALEMLEKAQAFQSQVALHCYSN